MVIIEELRNLREIFQSFHVSYREFYTFLAVAMQILQERLKFPAFASPKILLELSE